MDLAVVPYSSPLTFASGGSLVGWEDTQGVPGLLLSLCFCLLGTAELSTRGRPGPADACAFPFGPVGTDFPEGCELRSEPEAALPGLCQPRELQPPQHHRAPLFKMDPTDAELAAIADLPGVFTWAGVTGALERALRAALGDPARVRELALVPRAAWDTMVSTLRVAGPADSDGNPGPPRDLTLVERARMESSRRVALLRMGIPPDVPGGASPPAPAPTTGPAPTGSTPATGARRLKLSSILDPTLDAEVSPLGAAFFQQLYKDYKAKFGDYPSPDADPSSDQVASLRQVVAAGAAPYADFSLFGPHGLRLLRKQTFTSYTLNVATGEWSKKEQPGPSSYHTWMEAWKVFRTTLLLLEIADAERLDAYAEHVRSYVTQFSDNCWWLIYRAENRLRCEHLERIRRTLTDRPEFGFTSARPWNACFAAAVRDSDFWTRELITPATLCGADDGSPKKKQKKGRYDGEDKSEKKDGVYVLNRPGGETAAAPPGTSHGGRYVKPTPKRKAGPADDANQQLVDKTAQSKASGTRPSEPRQPPAQKPPTPPRARPAIKRKRPDATQPATSSTADGSPKAKLKKHAAAAATGNRTKGASGKLASTQSLLLVPPLETAWPDYQPLVRGPRPYGMWMEQPADSFVERPWALILFSGRRRKGDLPNWLVHYGFMVCCVDRDSSPSCDVLDESQWNLVERDIIDGHFSVVWAGTPCGTFSPLREVRPGPRPLRTVEHIEGKPDLSPSEKTQVKEANVLVERTHDALVAAWDQKLTWGLENPAHGENKPELWQMPLIRQLAGLERVAIAAFDQCKLGLDTVKPTKILYSSNASGFEVLDGLRCDHPPGSHGSTAGKKERGPAGSKQWASKRQGEYTPHLSQIIAHSLYQGPGGEGPEDGEGQGEQPGLGRHAKPPPFTPQAAQVEKGGPGHSQAASKLHAELVEPALAILEGRKPEEFDTDVIGKIRAAVLTTLGADARATTRERTAPASTPLRAEIFEAWGKATDDPDSATLAGWLDHGAPLGLTEDIPSTGVFPPVVPRDLKPHEKLDRRVLEGWSNYKSAEEEAHVLEELITDYERRGFCTVVSTLEEAIEILGGPPVLNRLGVLVKEKKDAQGNLVRKARVIWDLKESQVNKACNQGERIILPRLLDVVASLLAAYRRGRPPFLACIDIRDAFMNIPAGKDRRFTVAAVPRKRNRGKMHKLVLFNTLVFGSASSPTVWGRAAAWLGRTTAATGPADTQVYVDDPVFVLDGPHLKVAASDLTVALLWAAVSGYPVKLSKACGGKDLEWVGARIRCVDAEEAVIVTLPASKIQALLQDTDKFLGRSVVGSRELRSFTGALSFVAGLVPHLRPFLATFWAVLTRHDVTGEGRHALSTRRLIHVRRIRPALCWVRALLAGGPAIEKIFYANPPKVDLEIVTDACPWGMGGIRREGGRPTAYFYLHIPDVVLRKFGAERGLPKYNTLWEGLALLVAFRLWLPSLVHGATFRAKSDNLGFLMALAKGSARSADLNVLAREFAFDQATRAYHVNGLVHIPGVTNVQADALSRQFAPEAKRFPKELLEVPRDEVLINDHFWQWVAWSVWAGLEPYPLTPDGMYIVMGGLKEAGYRSAMQYLDLAKQEHVQKGHPWTDQLALAYRVCSRSCKRGLGPAKQAAALPLDKLAGLDQSRCQVPSGPARPVTSTIVASWWLLRELEASRAKVRHITLDFGAKVAAWLLPSSKTDVAALGATRKHSCSCAVLHPDLCPFHTLASLVQGKQPEDPVFVDLDGCPPSKHGWADTFQRIAALLGLPLCHHNGARAFTGHTARATGAQFLAFKGIEIWRIQIFGRWGSEVILRYVRDAPLAQLNELAIEAGDRETLAKIRSDLDRLMREVRPSLAIPDSSWHFECQVRGAPASGPAAIHTSTAKALVLNTARGGKLHKCLSDFSSPQVALNPSSWRTCCLWPFASGDKSFQWEMQTLLPQPEAGSVGIGVKLLFLFQLEHKLE
ncbi:unnamed protein product [Symbiodinium sp. CCMP2592]|nr:unnamed protein product [Symbiodinium sp. CCMP2592]